MTDDDVVELLNAAAVGVSTSPVPTDWIVAAGRRRASRRRRTQVLAAVAAAAAVGVLVPLGLARDGPVLAAQAACPVELVPAVLPQWARAGFSEPEPVSRFVLGDRGDIVAIVFGPLVAPPALDRGRNKILWVSRDPAATGPLTITAGAPGQATVTHELPGGPGPSIVDVAAPGCWTLQVHWAGQVDTVRLRYAAG